jgi:dsDNA-specific endonuclease/ATPase MutS2
VASETERELRRYLEGVHFAANTEDLVSIAMSNGAPEELIEQLEDLPSKEFSNLEEVAEAMEELREDVR